MCWNARVTQDPHQALRTPGQVQELSHCILTVTLSRVVILMIRIFQRTARLRKSHMLKDTQGVGVGVGCQASPHCTLTSTLMEKSDPKKS